MLTIYEILRLKAGDTFYESRKGYEVGMIIKEPAKLDGSRCTWAATDLKTGAHQNYLITEGYEHYGPKIYLSSLSN